MKTAAEIRNIPLLRKLTIRDRYHLWAMERRMIRVRRRMGYEGIEVESYYLTPSVVEYLLKKGFVIQGNVIYWSN